MNNPDRVAFDVALGAGGVTSPWWIHWLHTINEVAATVAMIGGAVLVVIRIYVAIRDASRPAK